MSSEEPATRLEIQPVGHGECTVLHVRGEFNQNTAPAMRLRDEIVSLNIDGPPCLVLDLEGITAWDEEGVGAVIATLKRVMVAGGRLVVAATPADLMERFRWQRLDQRLELRETVEQAVNEFRAPR
ncbi:STAS domain-containing protein [Streptosporangium lutulentum]|uniref:STAS domain-containing protein n=1 Tax=Streptosporangium lutulentum TaxID=1461250 RepID=UPI00351F8F3D